MIEKTFDNFDLKQIADSGQVFRFNKTDDGRYLVFSGDKYLYISQNENNIKFDCTNEEYNNKWKKYFDTGFDYGKIISDIEKGSDTYLKAAAAFGRGIRILNQEPFEMIISFIISQQMRIPRIKLLIEDLCRYAGEKIGNGFFAFPTPQVMADIGTEKFLEMGFGYRAKYLDKTSKMIADGKFDLEAPFDMDFDTALNYLERLQGIGRKVANCVLLFAYHKTSAFPIDTWIKKILAEHYGGRFDLEKYPQTAGIVQQYMYYFERNK